MYVVNEMTNILTISVPNSEFLEKLDQVVKMRGKNRSEYICDLIRKDVADVYSLSEEQLIRQLNDHDSEMVVLRNALHMRREAEAEVKQALTEATNAEKKAKEKQERINLMGKWWYALTPEEKEANQALYNSLPEPKKPIWEWRVDYWEQNIKEKVV